MSDRDKTIIRIRKLLRRANSRLGVVDHEAESAEEEARRLMGEHGIREEEVDEDVILIASGEDDLHRREIASAIAYLLGCKALVGSGVAFKGRKETVERATEFLRSLLGKRDARAEIPAEIYGFPINLGQHVDWRTADKAWRECFAVGFTIGITTRLRNMRDTRDMKVAENAPQVAEAVRMIEQGVAAIKASAKRHVLDQAIERGRRHAETMEVAVPAAARDDSRSLGTSR